MGRAAMTMDTKSSSGFDSVEPLYLEDFRDRQKRYIVEGYSRGEFFPKLISNSDPAPLPGGFVVVRMLGLTPRKRIPIALYTNGRSLEMNIGETRFDLSQTGVVAVRQYLFPWAKRFSISGGQQVLFSSPYWDIDCGDWTDDGDILSYAESVTSSPRRKAECLYIFNARRAGKDLGCARFAEQMQRDLDGPFNSHN